MKELRGSAPDDANVYDFQDTKCLVTHVLCGHWMILGKTP